MLRLIQSGLLLGSLFAPVIVLGGQLHSREYSAVVVSVGVVKSFELDDGFTGLQDGELGSIKIRVGTEACRIRVRVDSDYKPLGAKPIDIFASKDACKQVQRGLRTQVQYFGLADMFRLVAIQIDGAWRSLPRMRLTTSPLVQDCLASRSGECKDVHSDAPL
jgi:hypothetical protein